MPAALANKFIMNAEIEDQQSGNPEQEPKGFHRVRLSYPRRGADHDFRLFFGASCSSDGGHRVWLVGLKIGLA